MNKVKKTRKMKTTGRLAPFQVHLTTGQAASHCQVSIPTVKRWIRDGWLVAFKTPGRHWRIEFGELQRFLKGQGMPALPVPSSDARILIVDDEPNVVDVISDFLGRDTRGFKVEAATDGYEALIKVGAFQPTLLILDVAMPRLDGVEVCRRLKADPETRTIKILGITGHPDSVPALLEAGADACLTKPVDFQQVRQEVDRLLGFGET